MAITKEVDNWRIEIFLDSNKAVLHRTNNIVEDGNIIARFPHSSLTCTLADLGNRLEQIIHKIEEAQP